MSWIFVQPAHQLAFSETDLIFSQVLVFYDRKLVYDINFSYVVVRHAFNAYITYIFQTIYLSYIGCLSLPARSIRFFIVFVFTRLNPLFSELLGCNHGGGFGAIYELSFSSFW